MTPHLRRLTRLMFGIAATGLTATLLTAAPTAAQAAAPTQPDCSTEAATFREAYAAMRAAAAVVRTELAERVAARATYDADPTKANSLALKAAIADSRQAKATHTELRTTWNAAKTALDTCRSPIQVSAVSYSGDYNGPAVDASLGGLMPGANYRFVVTDYCGPDCYGNARADSTGVASWPGLPIVDCVQGQPISHADPDNPTVTTTGTINVVAENDPSVVIATRTVTIPAGICPN